MELCSDGHALLSLSYLQLYVSSHGSLRYKTHCSEWLRTVSALAKPEKSRHGGRGRHLKEGTLPGKRCCRTFEHWAVQGSVT